MTTSSHLLCQGARNYIGALAAIGAFEKAVRDACKKAYDKHKPQLTRKFGLKAAELDDYDDGDPADGYVDLGIEKRAQDGRRFYVYFRWEETDDGEKKILACVSLDFPTKGDRDSVFKKLHRNRACSIEWGDNGSYLWLRKPLKLSDPISCASALSKLLKEWLAEWSASRSRRK